MTLSDEQIQDLLRVGNPTNEECRLIRIGWDAAIARMRTQGVPDGWLRAIDEALVVTHLGVADESDTYEQAREKLTNLIGWHVDVATDPAVNGGWKLVPIELTKEMRDAWDSSPICEDDDAEFRRAYSEMLAAAPEAKPSAPNASASEPATDATEPVADTTEPEFKP